VDNKKLPDKIQPACARGIAPVLSWPPNGEGDAVNHINNRYLLIIYYFFGVNKIVTKEGI
jgi:hypothetical protein